jgi:hypothetical protein
VQGGDVLQQEAQVEALVGAREQWCVRGAVRVEIGLVQGGDVLQQEAQGEALVGAQEHTGGAEPGSAMYSRLAIVNLCNQLLHQQYPTHPTPHYPTPLYPTTTPQPNNASQEEDIETKIIRKLEESLFPFQETLYNQIVKVCWCENVIGSS